MSINYFGIGQIFDLLLIPDLVERENFRYRARLKEAQYPQLPHPTTTAESVSDTQLILKLLSKRAQATLADYILATGKNTSQVKAVL